MNICFFILLIILLSYLNWVMIILFLPLQILYNQIRRRVVDKKDMNYCVKLLVFPYWLWEKCFRGGWQRYVFFKIGELPSIHLRRTLYKYLGVSIGKKSVFHFKTEIRCPYRLKVGDGSIIGDNAILDARNGLTIGQDVNLSSNVSIYTEQHDYRDPWFRCTERCKKPVRIGDRVWIGSSVVVLPGVTIGEGAVCCAGCVVTKDVEPYSVVAGIPAIKINERPRGLVYHFSGKTCRLY